MYGHCAPLNFPIYGSLTDSTISSYSIFTASTSEAMDSSISEACHRHVRLKACVHEGISKNRLQIARKGFTLNKFASRMGGAKEGIQIFDVDDLFVALESNQSEAIVNEVRSGLYGRQPRQVA